MVCIFFLIEVYINPPLQKESPKGMTGRRGVLGFLLHVVSYNSSWILLEQCVLNHNSP